MNMMADEATARLEELKRSEKYSRLRELEVEQEMFEEEKVNLDEQLE